MDGLELNLNDLSSTWIDALDEWQCALREGPEIDAPEWARLQAIENRMRDLAQRQQSQGRAFEAALENVT